jgi:DNA-binding NarL/FixJ family response regulator
VGRIRVVLADDHRDMVAIVRATLGEEFEIVAAVEDGRQAVAAVVALDPDVLITDISMPMMDGLQVASQLQKSHCRTKVIFLTMHKDSYFIAAALSAGVSGYVTKTLLSSDLVHAIEVSMKGDTFVSGSMPH